MQVRKESKSLFVCVQNRRRTNHVSIEVVIMYYSGVVRSSATTTTMTFDPKFRCPVNMGQFDEAADWVREFCKGGFQITPGAHGYHPSIRVCTEQDYMMFILKWQN